MKAIFVILLGFAVLLPIAAGAEDFGVVSTADFVRFRVKAIDADGIEQAADSGHVLVWFEGEVTSNSASYSSRWTTAGASGSEIDSVRFAGHTYYYFVDQVADIDNGEGNGVYTGTVVLFTDGESFDNHFSFTLAGDELADYWAEVARVGDSIDAYDDWIGQQSEVASLDGWDPASDEVLADLMSISGDAAAADNLETMVDGTGGQKLTLGGLHIRASGNDTALVAHGSGSGLGAHIWGGETGDGLYARGGVTGGAALAAYSPVAQAAYLAAGGVQPTLLILNDSSGHAASLSSEGGDGLVISADTLDGLQIYGGVGDNRHAVEIMGGVDPAGNLTGQDAVRIVARGGAAEAVSMSSDSAGGVTLEAKLTGSALKLISPDTGMFVDAGVAGIVSDIVGTVTPTDTNSSGEALAVMPDHWSVADSIGYQGAAAGLDSAQVARAVWNTPYLNHVGSGTFGFNLDAPISGITGGSGAYAVTLVAFDPTAAQTLPGVKLAVRNSDQSSLLALTSTGSLGTAAVNLDAGSYLVSATAPGYTFTAFHTLTVAGPVTDSVLGQQFDPGSPASPSLCRVYGHLYQANGEAESDATVAANLPSGVTRASTLIISPHLTETTTDATGYFYLDLLPSVSLTGSPQYEFTINLSDGTILRKRLSVPDATSWQLTW